MKYIIQATKSKLLSQFYKMQFIILFMVMLSFYGCFSKYHQYPLLDKQGNEVILYGDSIQKVTLYGSMTPFNDFIGKDYPRDESVNLNYCIKGFDSIKVLGVKINLWRLNKDSFVPIKTGYILYDTNDYNFTFSKKVLLQDSIRGYDNVYEKLQFANYFIDVESDSEITEGLTKLLVESKILFEYRDKTINISRIDTLYRNETVMFKVSVH